MELVVLLCLLAVSQGRAMEQVLAAASSDATEVQRVKRCANLWDDSCTNGGVSGATDDEDYFGSSNSPGKRSLFQDMRRLQLQLLRAKAVEKAKRCANVWDDSCTNGAVSGAADDGDYFGSAGSPGKRSLADQLRRLQLLRGEAVAKRCANVWDDSCVNGSVGGAADDGDYFGSASSPGKRSLAERLHRLQLLKASSGSRRCANVWDDSCTNGGVDGAADDGNYFDSDNSPGK